MKQPTSSAKAKRKTREELNQEARDRKRAKKHRGHVAGSRATGGNAAKNQKNGNGQKNDPRIGSKKPVPLGVTVAEKPEKAVKQVQQKEEKVKLSPAAELEMLENDDRLDALLERLEKGETLSADEQSWVDAKLDRIDELMAQLGISYDDEEEEESEDDLMRLLKGGN